MFLNAETEGAYLVTFSSARSGKSSHLSVFKIVGALFMACQLINLPVSRKGESNLYGVDVCGGSVHLFKHKPSA